jgi:predicted N-acetyltransferase YhbS
MTTIQQASREVEISRELETISLPRPARIARPARAEQEPEAESKRHGIGGRLIAEGLRRLRVMGQPLCVVLGHADYYPRHGFERASKFGIRWEKPVPDDVFFVKELAAGGLHGVSGVVRYRPEFDAV